MHMAEYALAGYLTAAIDCRYHGERALPEDCHVDASNAYQDALCRCILKGNLPLPLSLFVNRVIILHNPQASYHTYVDRVSAPCQVLAAVDWCGASWHC